METNPTSSERITPPGPQAARESNHRPGRRRWWALLIVPIAAGALTMSAARAHGFGEGRHGGGKGGSAQGRIEHLLGAAGASDAQKAQVKAIWEQLRPQLKPLQQQRRTIRQQMSQAMATPTIDVARVEQLRVQSMQMMDKISALKTQGMVATAQVLTPEQRKAVLQKMEERRGRHGDTND